jgi:hypothetical protein
MKNLIFKKAAAFTLLLLILLLFISFNKNSEYCDRWEEGYVEGYCYLIVNCIEPIVPVCPVPLIGQERPQDGYNRGFEAGKRARR